MAVTGLFAFLVHPNKKLNDATKPRGKAVPLSGDLYKFMFDIFERSQRECNIDIALSPSSDGRQANEFRDLALAFGQNGTIEDATVLAHRLGLQTTRRSGLGLLFLLRYQDNQKTQILLSRFPTERAIMAEEGDGTLTVDYLEQVFLKNAHAYKAALFEARSFGRSELWEGRVVDKQINTILGDASRYWVYDFLAADFRTTPIAGTRRLARAILDASKATGVDFEAKQELHHAAGLAKNLGGQNISIFDFSERMGLSESTRELLKSKVDEATFHEKFIFNTDEYGRKISFRAVELSTGALVTAPSGEFQNLIKLESIETDGDRELVRISTEGILLADKLTRAKG